MSLVLSERLPLGRFVFDTAWTPLKGAHMHPLRFFAVERSIDPNDYLEVLEVVEVDRTNVAITRGGGLFVRDRGQYETHDSLVRLAACLNLLLCELTLRGVVSEPVTAIDIHDARLIGRHAAIVGGWGNHAARTFGPLWLLSSRPRNLGEGYSTGSATYWPPNCYWFTKNPAVLDDIAGLRGATQLHEISPSLPALLVAAHYHAARHNLAEIILSSWVITEQVLSSLWDKYVGTLQDRDRRALLADTRTFGAGVRAEVLLTAGVLSEDIYSTVQRARKIRNDMAHRAKLGTKKAGHSLTAMHDILRMIGFNVDPFSSFQRGRGASGQPITTLDPEFPFE
jgi:hypothetical protein